MSAEDALSKLTGMSREKMKEMFEVIKANREKISKCKMHDFSVQVFVAGRLTSRYRCSQCGGEVDITYKLAYEEGVKHMLHLMEKVKMKKTENGIECCSQMCSEDCPNYSRCPEVRVVVLEDGESYGTEV